MRALNAPPSGEQYGLVASGQRATIVEVAAGVRTYEVDGREVLQPYPVDAICDGAHGEPLIPWPNRLADGSYRFDTDPERQLPTGEVPVAGTSYDFRKGRRLGTLAIDYAFTDLERDVDGRAWVRLTRPDGATAEFWVDASYPIVELYTGDTLARDRRRRGLGTEPMTCPPNGFRSGKGLIRLDPGETVQTSWGVRLR